MKPSGTRPRGTPQRFPAALLSWDGLHLVLDLRLVEQHLREWLRDREQIRYLGLEGVGDAVRLHLGVNLGGVTARLGVELAEIRVKRRHLGLRLRRLKVLGGVRMPRAAVERLIMWLVPDLITVIPGEGILVVDLGRWLPAELELEVLTVQASSRSLHLWLGPGALADLPGPRRPALAAGGSGDDAAGRFADAEKGKRKGKDWSTLRVDPGQEIDSGQPAALLEQAGSS